jgi:hypothetical protein
MILAFQWNDANWLIELKNKIQLFIVCKRHISLEKTCTDWKLKDGKWYIKQVETKSKNE